MKDFFAAVASMNLGFGSHERSRQQSQDDVDDCRIALFMRSKG
jgi:hypothetical protein